MHFIAAILISATTTSTRAVTEKELGCVKYLMMEGLSVSRDGGDTLWTRLKVDFPYYSSEDAGRLVAAWDHSHCPDFEKEAENQQPSSATISFGYRALKELRQFKADGTGMAKEIMDEARAFSVRLETICLYRNAETLGRDELARQKRVAAISGTTDLRSSHMAGELIEHASSVSKRLAKQLRSDYPAMQAVDCSSYEGSFTNSMEEAYYDYELDRR